MDKSTLSEKELNNFLMEKLKGIVEEPYKINPEVLVPYKHIYIPNDNLTKLEIWCFSQDIMIYQTLFDKTVKHKDCKILKENEQLIDVILEKDQGQYKEDVGLPYVILELKKKQPNTHEIMTYSQKAEMIKTIFPYCQFLLLIYGNISALTYRHGINFDEIISLKNIEDIEEIENLKRILLKHFEIAKTSLKNLTDKNRGKNKSTNA